jgi:hypothetical protein
MRRTGVLLAALGAGCVTVHPTAAAARTAPAHTLVGQCARPAAYKPTEITLDCDTARRHVEISKWVDYNDAFAYGRGVERVELACAQGAQCTEAEKKTLNTPVTFVLHTVKYTDKDHVPVFTRIELHSEDGATWKVDITPKADTP